MIEKPRLGEPCNGCGLCCERSLCPLGSLVFATAQAPCPGLERRGERAVCGLIEHPRQYAPVKAAIHGVAALRQAAVLLTGAGQGCDAHYEETEGERVDSPAYIQLLLATARLSKREVDRAVSRWI